MRRFTMTSLAAAAVIAAIAVVALPAIGDSGTKGTDKNSGVSDFAACLATHGLPGAPTTGLELKQWLAGKENQDSRAVHAAIDACKRSMPGASAPGPDVARMIACVRSHGIDAPSAPEDFKRWVGDQQKAGVSKALDNALIACKMALAPPDKANDAGTPDCGATDKPPAAKADKPPAAKADKPPAAKAETTPGDTNST